MSTDKAPSSSGNWLCIRVVIGFASNGSDIDKQLISIFTRGRISPSYAGKTFAEFFGKGAMDILARGFAKILELRIITGGCVRQFHHIEEELPTKRQVNVFTESLNDWPSLADGSPAFL